MTNPAALPENIVIVALVLIAIVVLLVPISLRLAGLTGQQIAEVIGQTMQFAINLVREFRAQNKQP